MKGLIIIAALLLTGCSDEPTEIKPVVEKQDGYRYTHLITMNSGMQCVVFDGYKAGGLSCDWNHKSKPELIKFPGYDCDDSEIKGHCTKWNITQAEYDKKNAHLFKVTE